jgi:hypothetical protein
MKKPNISQLSNVTAGRKKLNITFNIKSLPFQKAVEDDFEFLVNLS